MKVEIKNAPVLAQLRESVKKMSMATLTHFDGNDVLTGRSLAPLEMDDDGALWFFADRRSLKTKHLRRAYLTVTHPAGGRYVALAGHGEIHLDRARIKRLRKPFSRSRFPDRGKAARVALLKFVPEATECWDALHSRMDRMLVITF